MRPMILTAATLTAALFLPAAALAFEADSSAAANPGGSAQFSDPDDAPTSLGGLQVFGSSSDSSDSGGVYIPQSPASSDVPALLYSSSAFRSAR
jgi:hypothetical protein